MTGWGRSQKAVLAVGVGMVVVCTAACASAPARIPSASATPVVRPTTIAPGVSVAPSELVLPPYTVSTSNPLPPGVSAATVVKDVVIDDLIENAALVRSDPSLLAYSDVGGVLAVDQSQISANKSTGLRLLSIDDAVSNMALGRQTDPNNAAAQIAVVVRGTETTKQRSNANKPRTSVENFKVQIWLLWSTTADRYLQCDVSTLS